MSAIQRTITLTDAEWNALKGIVGNGWGDGDFAGYGGDNPRVQQSAMRKLREAKPLAAAKKETERPATGIDVVSDAEVELQFRGTNFGGADHREVLSECLRSTAKGYAVGSTIRHIATNLGLIEQHGHDVDRITDKGLRYLADAKAIDVEQILHLATIHFQPIGPDRDGMCRVIGRAEFRMALEELSAK